MNVFWYMVFVNAAVLSAYVSPAFAGVMAFAGFKFLFAPVVVPSRSRA